MSQSFLPSFLKTGKNKRFNYTPRHFDPAEEARLKRKARREAMLRDEGLLGADENEDTSENSATPSRKLYPNGKRISFRRSALDDMSSSSYRASVKSSNIRLLIIVGGLLLLALVGYLYLDRLY